MDDLHSIAFSSNCCNLLQNSNSPYYNLGVFKTDMSQYMERSPPCDNHFLDHHHHHHELDFSTGYLQDVLFEFSSKRRRLLMLSDHQINYNNVIENCWTTNLTQNCDDSTLTTQVAKSHDTISDMKTPEEENSETYESNSSSISNSHKESTDNYQWTPEKGNLYCIDPSNIFSSGCNEQRKKRLLAKVVYPFALVKPGGFEGDVTLNDINERILMPPTRPVRHPVGDFACRPLVSPDGPGLSGKAVVAFTRIHTQGRGTITIIRTRG